MSDCVCIALRAGESPRPVTRLAASRNGALSTMSRDITPAPPGSPAGRNRTCDLGITIWGVAGVLEFARFVLYSNRFGDKPGPCGNP